MECEAGPHLQIRVPQSRVHLCMERKLCIDTSEMHNP